MMQRIGALETFLIPRRGPSSICFPRRRPVCRIPSWQESVSGLENRFCTVADCHGPFMFGMGQNGDVCAPLSGRCAPILVSLSDGGLGSTCDDWRRPRSVRSSTDSGRPSLETHFRCALDVAAVWGWPHNTKALRRPNCSGSSPSAAPAICFWWSRWTVYRA